MRGEERKLGILQSAEWWNADLLVEEAESWYQTWAAEIGKIRANQWEFVRRLGESAASYPDYYRGFDQFLNGEPDPHDPRRKKVKGAVDRDKAKRGWGQRGLADDLLASISRASEPQQSPRAEAFRRKLKELPAETAGALRDWVRLRQARHFVDALVVKIKIEDERKRRRAG